MKPKSFHRNLVTKFILAKKQALAPVKIFNLTQPILLLVCTGIDILRQSFTSGQFWNSIIVVCCLGIILVWSLTLVIVRRVEVSRWLSSIPRERQVGRSDLGEKMTMRILKVRQHCIYQFKNQRDFSAIEHAGLQNPLRRKGSNGGEGDIEVPYWEFADSIPMFMEDNFTSIIADFTMPPYYSVRDYIERAIDEKLLDSTNIRPVIDRFLELYEKLRFSGSSITHSELIEMVEAFSSMLNHIQQPELPQTYRSQQGTSLQTSQSLRTPEYRNVYQHEYPQDSSRSVGSSSQDSVRRYPSGESMISSSTFGSLPSSSYASVLARR